MPYDQIQVRDYAVVIHAGNDEWTWQVMDFDARIAASRPGAGSRERLAQRPVRGGRGRRLGEDRWAWVTRKRKAAFAGEQKTAKVA
jgi:hypothetical protein